MLFEKTAAVVVLCREVERMSSVSMIDGHMDKMTNYERIKSMSIDEMAECSMLFFTCPYGTPYVGCEMGKQFDDDCIQCTKHWLESEVQENE